jgi:hypothetical protein
MKDRFFADTLERLENLPPGMQSLNFPVKGNSGQRKKGVLVVKFFLMN